MFIQGIIGIGGEKKGYIKTINNEEIDSDQNINDKIILKTILLCPTGNKIYKTKVIDKR